MTSLALNPWQVESLDAFSFFCCPECVYRAKEPNSFQVHALQNHPQSATLFNHHEDDLPSFKDDLDSIKDEPFELDIDLSEFIATKEEDDCDKENNSEDSKALIHEEIFKEDFDEDDEDVPLKRLKRRKKSSRKSLKKEIKHYQCTTCHEEFKKKSDMTNHMASQHSDVQCDECDRKFAAPYLLTRHKYSSHKTVMCLQCNKSYGKAVYIRHMRTVHVDKSDQKFKCDLCPFTSHAQRYLSEHKTNCHSGKEEEKGSYHAYKKVCSSSSEVKTESIDGNNLPEDLINCPKCDRPVKPRALVIHFRKAHGCLPPGYHAGKRYICDQCSEEYASSTSLKRHIETTHTNNPGNSGEAKPEKFVCEECNAEFGSSRYYIIHYRKIHKSLPKEFKDHKQYICDKCPDVFLSEQTLRQHTLRIHTSDAVKKLYSSPRRKEKWKSDCPYCKKTFFSHSNFQEHVKSVHENNTPFSCAECPRKFALPRSLRKHKELVHEKVECEICGHVICNSFELKRHKAANHGIFPPNSLKCDLCPMFFMQRASLESHVAKKHPS